MVDSQDYYSIQVDITGNVIVSHIKSVRNRYKKLQKQLSVILGVNENLIEITRPTIIANGVRLNINIYVSYVKAVDMNIQSLMRKCRGSGQLMNILKESWNLNSSSGDVPNIGDFKYHMHESKVRKEHSVNVEMNFDGNDGNYPQVIYGNDMDVNINGTGAVEMINHIDINYNSMVKCQIQMITLMKMIM